MTKKLLGGISIVALIVCGTALPALAADYVYECQSIQGSDPSGYTFVGSAPATVMAGSEFDVSVFITGTPEIDILFESITVSLAAPSNAVSLDGLSRYFDGTGKNDPPGPISPAGVSTTSPLMTFRFRAEGAVGSTITFFPADVSAVVLEIGNPTNKLDVTCHYVSGALLASTQIVAASDPPVDDGTARVLGESIESQPAVAVTLSAQPSFTG